MTVKKALKEKNKLAKQIEEAYREVSQYNSIQEGNVRKYDPISKLKEADDLTAKLVELKTKTHKANIPVYDKIFLMAELKGKVSQLRRINTTEGKFMQGYASTVATVHTTVIDVVELNTRIKAVEEQIEKLQDELDTHNATTNI